MPAGRYSLTIERGARFDLTIVYAIPDPADPDDRSKDTPVNLTGWFAEAHVRESAGATTKLIDLASDHASGPRIVLGGAAGTVRLIIPAASTVAPTLPAAIKNAVWDLELTDPGNTDGPIRLLEGAVVFTPEVTHA